VERRGGQRALSRRQPQLGSLKSSVTQVQQREGKSGSFAHRKLRRSGSADSRAREFIDAKAPNPGSALFAFPYGDASAYLVEQFFRFTRRAMARSRRSPGRLGSCTPRAIAGCCRATPAVRRGDLRKISVACCASDGSSTPLMPLTRV
jgi:hypothetical protein